MEFSGPITECDAENSHVKNKSSCMYVVNVRIFFEGYDREALKMPTLNHFGRWCHDIYSFLSVSYLIRLTLSALCLILYCIVKAIHYFRKDSQVTKRVSKLFKVTHL